MKEICFLHFFYPSTEREKLEGGAVFYSNSIEFTVVFIISSIKFNVILPISGIKFNSAFNNKQH